MVDTFLWDAYIQSIQLKTPENITNILGGIYSFVITIYNRIIYYSKQPEQQLI